jgi:pantoate--beta-alanine ligase
MQIVRESIALRETVEAWRAAGERVALVPTMGALHAGHMALIDAARTQAGRVVASIFVNPLQFGAGEDLARYPRQEEADRALLEAHGCDLVWQPVVDDVYPAGFATTVSVAGVSERWDGAARPGHFDGVATVVAKLLIAVRPDVALFGEKDFQQLAVIRRMVTDLGLPVEIVGVPTVRDADGLALSSRNAYLSPDERVRALALPRALDEAARAIASGDHVATALALAKARLGEAGFGKVDYVALVDSATLEPLDAAHGAMRLIAAATIGTTRLIDNISVEMDTVGR